MNPRAQPISMEELCSYILPCKPAHPTCSYTTQDLLLGETKMVDGDYSKRNSSHSPLLLQCPRTHTVCSAEAEKDSTWVRRSLAAGAQATTGTLVPLFLSPLTLPAASVSPTGMKLGLGFTSESQGHLRLRSIQPPPNRSPVYLVFSLTFWTFLEVSVCTLEDLLFISH